MLKEHLEGFIILVFLRTTPLVRASTLCKPKCGFPSKWLSVARNVCYGTKNNEFGSFKMNRDCHLYKIRLSHVSGYQTKAKGEPSKRTRWGNSALTKYFGTIILRNNNLWCPESILDTGVYRDASLGIQDDVITFKKNETISAGTEFQVAFGRDFKDWDEEKNEGVHCIDVDVSCIV